MGAIQQEVVARAIETLNDRNRIVTSAGKLKDGETELTEAQKKHLPKRLETFWKVQKNNLGAVN